MGAIRVCSPGSWDRSGNAIGEFGVFTQPLAEADPAGWAFGDCLSCLAARFARAEMKAMGEPQTPDKDQQAIRQYLKLMSRPDKHGPVISGG